MARKYLVDKISINNMLDPYKSMISEYKTYMFSEIENKKGNHEKLTNIGKSFILIKDYANSDKIKDSFLSNLLISDINSCLYSLRSSLPKRYFYFSFRSIIETFIRLNVIEKETRIVDKVFNDFKEQNATEIADNELFSDFYSVLKSKYSKASGYVHGNKDFDFSLRISIEEVRNSDLPNNIEMIEDLNIIIDLIKKFFLEKDINLFILKHTYNRKIPVLKYLLSSSEIKIKLIPK